MRARGFGRVAGPRVLVLVALLAVSMPGATTAQLDGDGVHWPSFRGARAAGVAEGYATAESFDVSSGENVAWKVAVPGLGHSSPVVWGDRVFLTTAVGDGDNSLRVGMYGDIAPVEDTSPQAWKVLAYDKRSGELLWERTAHEGVPQVKRHTKSTHANPTMAVDQDHVVAFFGSEGLHVYDHDGNTVWSKSFGVLDSGFFMVPEAQWGFAASPVIHEGALIVQADVQDSSFLAALSLEDGSELWRTARADVPTFSTPTVVEADGRTTIVVNGFRHIGGYDAVTGEEIWRMEGTGDIPTPTPVYGHGLVFVTSAHGPGSPVYAIRATASGDASLAENESANGSVAWSVGQEGSYMPTPLVYGEHLYVIRYHGVLGVYDAVSGELAYRARLGAGAVTASPVAADGKVYIANEDGDVFVVRAGDEYELLSTSVLGEVTLASPAVSEGMLLFRTVEHLIAIAPE